MGLDAFVYCDCFERDNLRCGPPAGTRVQVAPSGNLLCDSSDEEVWLAFNEWKRTKACLHPNMILMHRALGSDQIIHLLQTELARTHDQFPLLLDRVLYSSTHTCDWIATELLDLLSREVKHLTPRKENPATADTLHHFQIQIAELIIAAQTVNKPICF